MLACWHRLNHVWNKLTSTDLCHGIDHGWEGQTEDTSCKDVLESVREAVMSPIHTEGVVDADSPSHTLLTLDRRENFGGVLEGNGSFSKRIGDREEVDEAIKVIREATVRLR